MMISPAVLEEIYWEERWLTLEAEGNVDLPAYTGSTMRGALGTVLRPELCAREGRCGEVCEAPEACPFFGLFEQSRGGNGKGSNQPKPLVLEAPLAEPLGEIARGGTVEAPYELTPGVRGLPVLRNEWRIGVPAGERLQLGLKGLGAAGGALDGVVEGVRRKGLEVKGGRLRLAEVSGGRKRLEIEETSGARRVRVNLLTPVLIKDGDRTCEEPGRLAELVLNQALVRAVTIYNTFFGRERVPFVKPEWPGVVATGWRLFRYDLTRRSYRQGRWMDFDGVVGWLEYEGAVESVLPWLRAAEVLHVGQKASFGLGRVEVRWE
ncbi:MAG: CRISPR system precrRNA processing endoribonuclease RAMP protein Cas6 [Bryobacterales bacterium]|nr:CRISPR system precrRNA processing endoribonuclease RAMP protein Cas6 [Bryobacterales bacterium]